MEDTVWHYFNVPILVALQLYVALAPGQINIESSGKVYASNFPANNESAMQLSDRISLHINPAKMQGMFTNKVRAYSTPDQLNVER
jgi:hypothetical protein